MLVTQSCNLNHKGLIITQKSKSDLSIHLQNLTITLVTFENQQLLSL